MTGVSLLITVGGARLADEVGREVPVAALEAEVDLGFGCGARARGRAERRVAVRAGVSGGGPDPLKLQS